MVSDMNISTTGLAVIGYADVVRWVEDLVLTDSELVACLDQIAADDAPPATLRCVRVQS